MEDLHGPDLCTSFDDTAFIGMHDSLLAQCWDVRVKPEDNVWVLGDISSGTKTGQLNALEWIKRRPGTKHLIAGNHDAVHPMHRNSHKWQRIYLEAFETVQSQARRRFSNGVERVDALLSHFAYWNDHTVAPRYMQWRLPDLDAFLIHGHTHSAERKRGREIHVGCDAWGLRPVSLEEVTELVFQ